MKIIRYKNGRALEHWPLSIVCQFEEAWPFRALGIRLRVDKDKPYRTALVADFWWFSIALLYRIPV